MRAEATTERVKLAKMILSYWKHMRLPFQLTLAPLFLWGVFLSEARAQAPVMLGFVSLHLFLYPGITAFNSAYDRDTGPVSGMERPPEVPPRLLGFSLLLQAIGAGIAAAAGAAFLFLYCAIALLAAGYSHPGTRWKASPWGSALVVALGQGLLGFAAGWAAGADLLLDMGSTRFVLGGIGAALTTLGLYPSTQVFQLEEDERRGDLTLARALGPVRALRLGSTCLIAAGAAAAWLMALEHGSVDALVIAAAYGLIAVHNQRFAARIAGGRLDLGSTYRWAMRTSRVSTLGFLCFIGFQLLRAD
jgi:1,4-dihydroxy-2-naphthoate octaprenyltransferase